MVVEQLRPVGQAISVKILGIRIQGSPLKGVWSILYVGNALPKSHIIMQIAERTSAHQHVIDLSTYEAHP